MQSVMKKTISDVLRNKTFMVGFAMILFLVIVAVFQDFIIPYGCNDGNMSARLQAPSSDYLFGTDDYGRDLFTRIICGVRLALKAAVLGTVIELFLGVVVGLLAGYYGGIVDQVLMFIADLIWSLPTIVVAMAIVMLLGKSLDNVVISLALAGWPKYARIVRTKTMGIKKMPFVETGIAFGEKKPAILFLYILPNIIPSIFVMASISMPGIITSTATLSFLGMGSQPPSPDWGLTISASASVITRAPWMAIYPGLALLFAVFGFSFLGEGLRDMFDPNLKID